MKKGKSRSIRGEVVDFDLMKVKQKIEPEAKPDDVKMREKYIDIRRRRNPRRNVSDLVNEQRQNELEAREKIAQSKADKEARLAAQAVEENDSPDTEVSPEATPTPTAKRTSRKKIVKKAD